MSEIIYATCVKINTELLICLLYTSRILEPLGQFKNIKLVLQDGAGKSMAYTINMLIKGKVSTKISLINVSVVTNGAQNWDFIVYIVSVVTNGARTGDLI